MWKVARLNRLITLITLISIQSFANSLIFGGIQYHSGSDSTITRKYQLEGEYYRELPSSNTIFSINFRDQIYNQDIIETSESFIKIRFAWEAYLIVYPKTKLEISSNIHEQGEFRSELNLIQGTVRIINIPDNRIKVIPSVTSDDITVSDIQGEIIITNNDDGISLYNLKLENSYLTSSMDSPKKIKEETVITFGSETSQEHTKLTKEKVSELNSEFVPPQESYYKRLNRPKNSAVEKKDEFTEFAEPKILESKKNMISLGILFNSVKYSKTNYNGDKFPTSGGGGTIKYTRELNPSFKVGALLYAGDLSHDEKAPKEEKTEFSYFTLLGANYMANLFWVNYGLGSSRFELKNLNATLPYDVVLTGMNIMIGVEKQWNFYSDFYITAQTYMFYSMLKTDKIHFAYGDAFPEKINSTMLSLGFQIGYKF